MAGTVGFLAAARLVVNATHRFVYPFLPAIARGLGVSLQAAGAMVSVRWAAGLATPAMVRAVQRSRGPERLIVAGLGLFVVGAAVTAATNVVVGAFVGFALMGLAKSTYDVSIQAFVADRVPYAGRARVLGVLELTWAGGFLVGAPAAGWLIDRAGWTAPFWAFGALAAVAVAVVGRVLDRSPHPHPPAHSAQHLHRSAAALLLVMALFSGASELVLVVMGAWLEDDFGISLLVLGGIATLLGVAELTGEGASVAFTDAIGKRRAVGAGIVVATAGYALLPAAGATVGGGVALLGVALAGFELTITASIPLASEQLPAARSRYLAWTVVAMAAGRAVGAFAGPRLYAALGLSGPALTAAAGNLLALLVLAAVVREHGAHATA
jgi:predicted MFS family arabinose efflux permease